MTHCDSASHSTIYPPHARLLTTTHALQIPLAVLDAVHAETQVLYDQLMDFWSDESVKEIDLA